jgi:hypothetical protein
MRAGGPPGLSRVLRVAQTRKLCRNLFGFDGVFQALVRSSVGALLEFYKFWQRANSWVPLVYGDSGLLGYSRHYLRWCSQRGVGGIIYAHGAPSHTDYYGTHRSDSPVRAPWSIECLYWVINSIIGGGPPDRAYCIFLIIECKWIVAVICYYFSLLFFSPTL